MRGSVGRIEGLGRAQLLRRSVPVLQVVPYNAQSVVRLRPFWPEIDRRLELLQGFSVLAFVFERQGQVVVRDRVFGI